jgi:hypothetical protein
MKLILSLSILAVILFPLSVFAFHAITKKLTSNKILVCKDFNQVKNGNKVEVYKLRIGTKDLNRGLERTSEFILPSEGQKVELLHQELHLNGKRLPNYHDVKRRTATVIESKLAGEEYKVLKTCDNKPDKSEIGLVKISPEQEAEFANKCFVASPNGEIDLKDINSIAF